MTEPTPNNASELLEDQLIVSEVDNPYVFTAKGYVNVGMGTITGLASQTMSLNENEHGIHPLTVFTEKGISMLRLANDGTYTRSDEISREVANKDNPCIIETDGPVYFASKRGLMVLVGSQVKCVSEQLSGKTNVFTIGGLQLVTDLGDFCDYLKSAFIAYDYRDTLLWIFNPNYTTCYIYAIKSGTFSKFTPSTRITTAVNDYPDYILQSGTNVYSLIDRQDINKDGTTVGSVFTPYRYIANMLTRPMKLENALALKSIMQIRHIKQFNSSAGMTMRMFASNNLTNWVELNSLRGVPWKYYRFRFDFTRLIATDRFAGSVVVTQERRTDKLR